MSESNTREGQWTEAEKAFLLWQVMQQWKPDKGMVNWSDIHIEGRTKKAIQNAHGKIMNEMKEKIAIYRQGNASGSAPVPKAPRKRAPRKKKATDDGSDASDDAPPAKKQRAAPRKKAAAKKDDSDDPDINDVDNDSDILSIESDPEPPAKPAKKKAAPRKTPVSRKKKEAKEESVSPAPDDGADIMDAHFHFHDFDDLEDSGQPSAI